MIDIRSKSAKLLKDRYGISIDTTLLLFEKRWLDESRAKKILLKEEYQHFVEPHGKTILKNKLAEKYCVSVDLVKKIVQGEG